MALMYILQALSSWLLALPIVTVLQSFSLYLIKVTDKVILELVQDSLNLSFLK